MNAVSFHKKPHTQACMIWLHGLGADSSDMKGLANALPVTAPVEHIFLDAPYRAVTVNAGMRMRAWYDIAGFDFKAQEDEPGIQESTQIVMQNIQKAIDAGYQPEQIMIAGFSQGGAIALYAALHYPNRLAGVVTLSAYLPLAQKCQPLMPRDTPIFMAYGQRDNLVLPMFSQYSSEWLHLHGYKQTNLHEYPMMHEICQQEIQDLAQWIDTHIKRI